MEHQEETDGEHRGQAHAAAPDDGPQRGADQEEHDAGEGQHGLALHLDPEPVDLLAAAAALLHGAVQEVDLVAHQVGRHVVRGRPGHGGGFGRRDRARCDGGLPGGPQAAAQVGELLGAPCRVPLPQAVHGHPQLPHGEHLVVVLEQVLVRARQAHAREVEADLIAGEGAGGQPMPPRLVAHPAMLVVDMPVVQGEHHELPVRAALHRAGARADHRAVGLEGRAVVVDQHVVQRPGLRVLVHHPDAEAVDPVVEDPRLEVHRGLLLGHVPEQRPELELGHGQQIVAEEEGERRDRQHGHGHRGDDAVQAHAGRAHGHQLGVLAQAAHGHDAAEQHRQGQRQGHEAGGGVGEQLGHHVPCQALAHQVVHVLPQELHHQDEQHDREGHQQGTGESAYDHAVKPFHRRDIGGGRVTAPYAPSTRSRAATWELHSARVASTSLGQAWSVTIRATSLVIGSTFTRNSK